jgi:7-cyano-7-deazaguanine reductase
MFFDFDTFLRGGLDINPWRANFSTGKPGNLRTARQ